MQNETIGTEHQQPQQTDADRSWAARMAREKEDRDIKRHDELKQLTEHVAAGLARAGVAVEETATKVDAIFETVVGKEPTNPVAKVIFMADNALKAALPTLRVTGALAAVGYGGYRGVQGVRGYLARRAAAKAQG